MSTVSPLDHITLDPGDSGIQWIPGVGFRPVDMTEELPFFGQMDCDIIDTGNQCEQGDCNFGKGGGGKYDVQLIPPVYDLPIIPYAPAYNDPLYATPYVPVTTVFWDTPTWLDDPWDPPEWIPPTECCTFTTPPPSGPPGITGVPSPVPLGDTGFFLLTALAAVAMVRRFA